MKTVASVALAIAAAFAAYGLIRALSASSTSTPGGSALPNNPSLIRTTLQQAGAAKNPAVKRQLISLARQMEAGNLAAQRASQKGPGWITSLEGTAASIGGAVVGSKAIGLATKAVKPGSIDLGEYMSQFGASFGKVFGILKKAAPIAGDAATVAEEGMVL